MSDEHGNWGYLLSESFYFVSRNLRMGIAKFSTTVLNAGRAAHTLSENLKAGGTFEAAGKTIEKSTSGVIAGGIAGTGILVGVVSLISAAMVQLDYRHWVDRLKDMYKDELSSKLGKPVRDLTEKDVYKVANGDAKKGIKGNRTIAEQVKKLQTHRTEGVVISVAASLVALFSVAAILAMPAVAPAVGWLNGLFAATTTAAGASVPAAIANVPLLAGVPLWMAEVATGLTIYNVLKPPMHWAAHKMLGMDHENTHEKIAQMQRDFNDGIQISRSRVLDVFLSANPKMSQVIIEARVPLDKLTADINSHKIHPTELAFTVQGETSHSGKPAVKAQGFLRACYGKVCHLLQVPIYESPAFQTQTVVPVVAAPVEYNNPTSAQPFVDRLGLTKANTSLGYAERINQEAKNTVGHSVQS